MARGPPVELVITAVRHCAPTSTRRWADLE